MSDESDLPPYAFAPKPGQTSWWSGDPSVFPFFHPGDRHRHFISRTFVLSPEQCRLLIECFERCREEHSAPASTEYWSNRYIWQENLPDGEIDAVRIMQQIRLFTLATLLQGLRQDDPLFSDTAQLVHWPEGVELQPHVDNMNPDGTPNPSPQRAFSSLLYLNDDYEGGETYFPGHKIRIKPTAGALVIFGSGPEYVHGVSRVTKGSRYTYAGWFTYNKKFEDQYASRIY